LSAPIIKEWVDGNQERVNRLSVNGCENCLEVVFGAGIDDMNLTPERAYCRMKLC
jgi:hypothetical protein